MIHQGGRGSHRAGFTHNDSAKTMPSKKWWVTPCTTRLLTHSTCYLLPALPSKTTFDITPGWQGQDDEEVIP